MGACSCSSSKRLYQSRLLAAEEGLAGEWLCDADGFQLSLAPRAHGRLHCVTSNSRIALLQWQGAAYDGKEVYWNSGAPVQVQVLPRGNTLKWRKWNYAAGDWFAPRTLRRLSVTEAAARGPYEGQSSLWDVLAVGHTVLLRGSWLLGLRRTGGVLPPRQELPQGAAWEPLELQSSVEEGRVRIVALSYCWQEPEHPDPEGLQLRRVAELIERRLGYTFPDDTPVLQDLALFWDYACLPQEPRSGPEQEAFDQGLSCVNLWYAHSSTEVWLLTNMPQTNQKQVSASAYGERGWPVFERAVSGLITPGDSFLDVGLWEKDEDEGWAAEARKCKAQREPPLLPRRAAAVLATKNFTQGADLGKVLRMYERTYREVLGSVRSLILFNLPEWGDREAEALAECLPDCPQLKELNLSYDNIGAAGASALGAAVAKCGQLRAVYMTENPLGDEGALALLPGLACCPSLELLMLSATGIGDLGAGAVAAVLLRCHELRVLCVDRCRIADCGAAALRSALAQSASLEQLQISANPISERGTEALKAAWVQAGKKHATCLALGFEPR